MLIAADTDIWRWQPHPEVWVLVAGAIFLAWYAVKVVGPNAVPAGEPVYERRHAIAYVAAIASLWAASDWPMHDVSEEYLYSVHMIQHLIISFIVPPLLLAATPEWLARLIMSSDGRVGAWTRRMTHPVVAGVTFNIVVALTHLTWTVNTSVTNGPFHYVVHLVVFVTSVWMWVPVMSPIKELRLGFAGQMVYLFLMSVIPTVPAAFLTFAEGSLYDAYDHDVRLWGINVTADQQMAGLIMKLVGGIYLWTWIVSRYFAFGAGTHGDEMVLVPSKPDDLAPELDDVDLTYEAIQAEFDRAGPAPAE